MQEIAEGKTQLPPSSARRHHFVPAFALARFAQPPALRDGWLYQLDVRSGTPQRTRPNDAAFVKDLYTYVDREGELSRTVESFFSIVEKHAAPALDRLCQDPGSTSPQDRLTIAFFLAFQESRTPEGLFRAERIRQSNLELKASMGLSSLEAFRQEFDCEITRSMSLEELEDMRKRMQNQLLEGRVGFEAPRTGAMTQILNVASEIAREIFSLDWIVLTAEEGEFITSDRPISMVDHAPPYPWSGNGWRSSDQAISFYPMTPVKALFMKTGDHGLTFGSSSGSQVRRLNLMTYGWADRFIYGRSQETVSKVRQQARSHPKDVVKPKPPKRVLAVPPDAISASVTAEYARRGWPRTIPAVDKDGKTQEMGYVVIDFDEPAGSVAQLGTEIAQSLYRQGDE